MDDAIRPAPIPKDHRQRAGRRLIFQHRQTQGFTPPGSAASIHFGKGLTTLAPGALQSLYLVVSDIEAARDELVGHGVAVSEVFHRPAGQRAPGRDPERKSYSSFATFSDPDGNGWLLQEVKQRLPGR